MDPDPEHCFWIKLMISQNFIFYNLSHASSSAFYRMLGLFSAFVSKVLEPICSLERYEYENNETIIGSKSHLTMIINTGTYLDTIVFDLKCLVFTVK